MKPTCLLLLALALCAGCRSDGGIDRMDSERGLAYSCDRVASRYQTDVKRSRYLFSSIPSAFSESCDEGWKNMVNTYHLYLENHETE